MGTELPGEVTTLLRAWRAGDSGALDALVPQVYKELHRIAHFQLQKERPNHTLQSTALVHEAYARLVGQDSRDVKNRSHFFALAAHLMRQILVDYARQHRAEKRGAGVCTLTFDDAVDLPQRQDLDVIALDDALNDLAKIDVRQSRVVEFRYFAGLSLKETAEALEIAESTVRRDWTVARAWLHRELSRRSQS
jgi:RNA polymerase sigma factor (TIGR02999 family)